MRPQDGQLGQPADITEEEESAAVWRLHEAGHSAPAISKLREISVYRVRQIVRNGPPAETKAVTPELIDETLRRWTDDEWRERMEGLAQRAVMAAEGLLDDETTPKNMKMQIIKAMLTYKTPKNETPNQSIHFHLNERQQSSLEAVVSGEFAYRPTHLIAETE